MTDARTVWGIHMEWDDATTPQDTKDIAIGWQALGDLNVLPAQRDAFKELFAKAYPADKVGAVPVKAGVLFRFAKEMQAGDIVVYPSKVDRLVNIGVVEGNYVFPTLNTRTVGASHGRFICPARIFRNPHFTKSDRQSRFFRSATTRKSFLPRWTASRSRLLMLML